MPGETSTDVAPTTPITPTRRPAAASTTTHRSTSARAGSASATAESARANAAETSAPATATPLSARRGAHTTARPLKTGVTTTARARNSRLATQAPQRSGVAGAELGKDPLVEDHPDKRNKSQVERDAKLDRARGSARQLERRQSKPVLNNTIPSTANSVARRVAAAAAPKAISASTPRSTFLIRARSSARAR